MTRGMRHAGIGLLIVSLFCGLTTLDAQSRRRPPTRYLGGHQPDQAEGARILEEMRHIALMGSYYQEFELRVLPRKDDERRLPGRAFGASNARGPITRIELRPESGAPAIFLVQSGNEPEVWRFDAAQGETVAVAGADVLAPLAGTTISAADLQLPFMYWTDFVFEGREPFRGRPTFTFLLFPPEQAAADYPGIGGVRVFIDTQYRAPLQAQWVDEDGKALKTITVIDLKKAGERWIVKSFEVRDERTRDKTQFLVQAVAFDVTVPAEWLEPEALEKPADLALPADALTPVR